MGINTQIQPRYAVLDGTVGLEGDGPKSGCPKEMNLIFASGNLAGLDATAARIMGFAPGSMHFLQLCGDSGLGAIDGSFSVEGKTIVDVRSDFIPAKHIPVSWLELSLRKSFVEWFVFKIPFLKIPAWGVRRY